PDTADHCGPACAAIAAQLLRVVQSGPRGLVPRADQTGPRQWPTPGYPPACSRTLSTPLHGQAYAARAHYEPDAWPQPDHRARQATRFQGWWARRRGASGRHPARAHRASAHGNSSVRLLPCASERSRQTAVSRYGLRIHPFPAPIGLLLAARLSRDCAPTDASTETLRVRTGLAQGSRPGPRLALAAQRLAATPVFARFGVCGLVRWRPTPCARPGCDSPGDCAQ